MKYLDILSLKQYIVENQKIEFVLESIGCHHIQYHPLKEYYSCGNYNGDNPTAVNVFNNKYLKVRNWTRSKEFNEHSDLFTLIEYNKGIDFLGAVKYLHSILGLEYKWTKPKEKVKIVDPLYVFKKHKVGKVDVKDVQYLNNKLIDYYVPMLHESWFRDGIIQRTRDKFNICYSYSRKRVIIPMRMWNNGELLGFNARTTVENYEEFGIKKYFITPTYPKTKNLYGLHENMEGIKKAGYVVVYESEKSVLKRDSRNDPTGVALSGHTISDEQVAILKGLGVKIIISMDKDIPLDEVRYICSKFVGHNVYYTWDKWDLLGEKDSVADGSNKVCNFLIKNCVKYDDKEHQKFMKSMKR